MNTEEVDSRESPIELGNYELSKNLVRALVNMRMEY
jgi:hypothetical protein